MNEATVNNQRGALLSSFLLCTEVWLHKLNPSRTGAPEDWVWTPLL